MSDPPSGRVFISYRRQESSGMAGRLYDRLVARFGDDQVFMDVDKIAPGADFAKVITQAVSSCQVLLAVIGPRWLVDAEGRRRLDDHDDFVRLEIAAALKRDIRVIPILVEGAVMPRREELPGSLAKLSRRNALVLRHESFRSDADRLLRTIEPILRPPPAAAPVYSGSARPVAPPPRAPEPQPTATADTAEVSWREPKTRDASTLRVEAPLPPATRNRLRRRWERLIQEEFTEWVLGAGALICIAVLACAIIAAVNHLHFGKIGHLRFPKEPSKGQTTIPIPSLSEEVLFFLGLAFLAAIADILAALIGFLFRLGSRDLLLAALLISGIAALGASVVIIAFP